MPTPPSIDVDKRRDGEDILDVVSSTSPLPDIGQTREHENLFLHNYFNPPPAKSGFGFFTPNSREDSVGAVDEKGQGGDVAQVGGEDNDSDVESIICLGEVSSSRDTEIHATTDLNKEDSEPVKIERFVISYLTDFTGFRHVSVDINVYL